MVEFTKLIQTMAQESVKASKQSQDTLTFKEVQGKNLWRREKDQKEASFAGV